MNYEDVKDKYIDGEALHKEFAKCREKLENAVTKFVERNNIEIIESKNDHSFFCDINHTYDGFKKENSKNKLDSEYKLFDIVGYVYDTKDYDISMKESLKIKNLKFYFNKFKKGYKSRFGDFEISNVEKENHIYIVTLEKDESKSKTVIVDTIENKICEVIKSNSISGSYKKQFDRFHEDIDIKIAFSKHKKAFKEFKDYDINFIDDNDITISDGEKESDLSIICSYENGIKYITIDESEYVINEPKKEMYSYDEYVEVIEEEQSLYNHMIPKLLYFEYENYIYVKNKEVNIFLNHNNYVTERLAKMYQDLAIKTTTMGNYCRNDNGNKNNLVSNALLKILRKGFKFNHRSSSKIFCYFTNIITRDFNETSKEQYKISNENEISFDSLIGSCGVEEA